MSATTTVTEQELPEKQRQLWLKATGAAEMKNWEYVISLMQPILEGSPGFLDGRKLLRHAAIQQHGGKSKKGLLGGLGSSTGKAKSAGKKNPAEGIAELEKVLAKDPFAIDANQLLYDFAMALGLVDTASFALETVRRGHPENTKLMHQLAEHYLAQDQPDLAVQVFNAILKVDPSDLNAQTAANHASARASMKQTGMDKKDTDMRSLLKNADEAKKIEESNRAGMTREQTEQALAEWSQKYQEDQSDLEAVRKIAGFYEQLEQWEEAHGFYAYAVTLAPGDTGLQRRAITAEQKLAESQIATIERQIAEAETEEERAQLEESLEQTRKTRAEKMVAEAQARVERNPTDPHLRLELSEHLFALGMYTEAIPNLQRARNNPNIRSRALLLLGRTYEGKNMYDMAASQYEEALADLPTMDATKKDLLYQLALVYEKQDKKEEYLESLKKIYEVDYSYKDVSSRVEASYS